ncbi:MAG: hypothetical protein HKN43_04740 [Rhodothermales bacterium]|nr:hypothetical protein [Rhodothermales bacterium]
MLDQDDPAGWPSFVFHPSEDIQQCPVCGADGPHSPRHSPYVCLACAARIVDDGGHQIVFADMNECRRADSDPDDPGSWEKYSSSDSFYLDGNPVTVFEGRFGGYVVQLRTPGS